MTPAWTYGDAPQPNASNPLTALARAYGVEPGDVSQVHDGYRLAWEAGVNGFSGPWSTEARMRLHKANPYGFRELMAWIRAHATERWGGRRIPIEDILYPPPQPVADPEDDPPRKRRSLGSIIDAMMGGHGDEYAKLRER